MNSPERAKDIIQETWPI